MGRRRWVRKWTAAIVLEITRVDAGDQKFRMDEADGAGTPSRRRAGLVLAGPVGALGACRRRIVL